MKLRRLRKPRKHLERKTSKTIVQRCNITMASSTALRVFPVIRVSCAHVCVIIFNDWKSNFAQISLHFAVSHASHSIHAYHTRIPTRKLLREKHYQESLQSQ